MKFTVYMIGNRIAIKTIKKTYCKVTHLTIEEAKKTINNINKNGWTIDIDNQVEVLL